MYTDNHYSTYTNMYTGMNLNSIISICLYGFLYILFFIIWMQIKKHLKHSKSYKEQLIIKNRIVRNHFVFKNTLFTQKNFTFPVPMIYLGNKDSNIELTIYTSLYCEMCKDVYDTIERLFLAYEDQIKINVYFKTFPKEDHNYFLHILYNVFLDQGGGEFLKALNLGLKNDNFKSIKINNNYVKKDHQNSFNSISNWFYINGLIGTPSIFINGYIYPYEFTKDDLYYHIEGFIENN